MSLRRWLIVAATVSAVLCSATVSYAASILGTVVADANASQAIRSAKVTLRWFDGEKWIYTTPVETDESGRFAIPLPDNPREEEYRKRFGATIYAEAPGYGLEKHLFWSGEVVQLRLGPEQVVKGLVRDSDGKPVSGARIAFLQEVLLRDAAQVFVDAPPVFSDTYVTTSDAQGRWQIRGITGAVKSNVPTDLDFELDDPRFVGATRIIRSVSAQDVVFTARVGGAISGRIVDETGKAQAGVPVAARDSSPPMYSPGWQYQQQDLGWASTTSGADGSFLLPRLARGKFDIVFNSTGRDLVAAAVMGVAVQTSETTPLSTPIVMKPGALVRGTVVGQGTGKPVAGVRVYAYGPQYPRSVSGGAARAVLTNADGEYSLRVAEGDSVVHIGSIMEGFAFYDPAIAISVKEDETKTLPPIPLPVAAMALLLVTDESGKPVVNLPLKLQEPNMHGGQWVNLEQTNGQGMWDAAGQLDPMISTIAKHTWRVEVPSAWEVVSPQHVTLPADSPVAVVVRKSDPRMIPHGRVLTPKGEPISGAGVDVLSSFPDGSVASESAGTDAEGSFTLSRLKPGARVEVRIQKWNYRRVHGGVIDGPFTIPADGIPPDLGTTVLIPITGSVTGFVTGTSNRPAAGVWVWSPDGDDHSIARTDARGRFTIQHVPESGPITLNAALGSRTATVWTSDHRHSRIQLPAAVYAAATSKAARNRQRGLALLSELARNVEPGQGSRNDGDGRDLLADMLASIDVDLAVQIGTASSGTLDDKVAAGILENAVRTDPVKARALFVAHRDGWTNADIIFYRNIEMAIAFANRDAAFANDCYHNAARMIGESIGGDALWNLTLLTRAGYRLNAPDADDWAQKAVAATSKSMNGDNSSAISQVADFTAEGDGVRAAALISNLPAEKRSVAAAQILSEMADLQPLEAKKLYIGWIADRTFDAANRDAISRTLDPATIHIVKRLAPIDRMAALAMVKTMPTNLQGAGLLWVASAEPDAATRQSLYRQAMATGAPWGIGQRELECLYLARRTHDTPIVNEMRGKLVSSIVTNFDFFHVDYTDNAARATTLFALEMPDMCRSVLEMAIQEDRDFETSGEDNWAYGPAIRAMALIDPDRAMQIAESARGNNAVMKSKTEIVRALLTPPAKWRDLAGDPRF